MNLSATFSAVYPLDSPVSNNAGWPYQISITNQDTVAIAIDSFTTFMNFEIYGSPTPATAAPYQVNGVAVVDGFALLDAFNAEGMTTRLRLAYLVNVAEQNKQLDPGATLVVRILVPAAYAAQDIPLIEASFQFVPS